MDKDLLTAQGQLEALKSAIQGKLFKSPADLEAEAPESNVEGDIFDVTHYCPCPKCCGKSSPEMGGHGLTASGKAPEEGLTIAADWSVLPKGTEVEIEGLGRRRVMDTGSAIKGNRIDVFMKDHEAARQAGRKQLRVKRVSNAGR